MTYIPIDKRLRILNRQDNIIWMATYLECEDTYHPGTTAYASMLTGKIEEYFKKFTLYKVDKKSFTSNLFSGVRHEKLISKLSLVKGKPGNIISMADYCGVLEK